LTWIYTFCIHYFSQPNRFGQNFVKFPPTFINEWVQFNQSIVDAVVCSLFSHAVVSRLKPCPCVAYTLDTYFLILLFGSELIYKIMIVLNESRFSLLCA